MLRRISKNSDQKDIIKSCPTDVVAHIDSIEYYVYGNEAKITPAFELQGDVIVVILTPEHLKQLPDGILYRKALYKVEDASYPDGTYDLEIIDSMNVWICE